MKMISWIKCLFFKQPSNLEEAHFLLRILLKEKVEDIKNIPKNKLTSMTHHYLGRTIRNDWKMWDNGRINKFFHQLGITHPDDMSGIIIESFHCKLNKKPFDLNKNVHDTKEYYKRINEKSYNELKKFYVKPGQNGE
jgi:hypothetical protein